MPYEANPSLTVDETVEGIKQTLISQKKLVSGDIFINTLSMPLTQARRTNTVKLSTVD
jgi:pyruvate kinase